MRQPPQRCPSTSTYLEGGTAANSRGENSSQRHTAGHPGHQLPSMHQHFVFCCFTSSPVQSQCTSLVDAGAKI